MNLLITACLPLTLLAYNFRQPLDVPTSAVSLLWALPICLGIAVIYKTLKLEPIRPALWLREVSLLFITIVFFMALVAAALLGIAWLAGTSIP
jgi:hypothetical protein